MSRPYGGHARREQRRSLGGIASGESSATFLSTAETGAARRDPCTDTAVRGRYTYQCARAAEHEGSHFDKPTDSWWSRTAAGKLRTFRRRSEEDGSR